MHPPMLSPIRKSNSGGHGRLLLTNVNPHPCRLPSPIGGRCGLGALKTTLNTTSPRLSSNESRQLLFLFHARCENPLDLLKMIEIVPCEHLHDRFDCLRSPFLVHSTDLPLFGSQRLE